MSLAISLDLRAELDFSSLKKSSPIANFQK